MAGLHMSVRDMIAAKGSHIYSVPETAKLRDAIAVLNEKNIGALLITNDSGKLVGILSERDIIRKSLKMETGFRDEPVTRSMTSNVVTVTTQNGIDDVAEIMTKNRFRHIPVVDNGVIKGVISIGDVVTRKIALAEQEAAALRDYISA